MWRVCIVFGSNVIHASWMGLVFCGTPNAIEDEWKPLAGAKAIGCPECQVAFAKWSLLRINDRSDDAEG